MQRLKESLFTYGYSEYSCSNCRNLNFYLRCEKLDFSALQTTFSLRHKTSFRHTASNRPSTDNPSSIASSGSSVMSPLMSRPSLRNLNSKPAPVKAPRKHQPHKVYQPETAYQPPSISNVWPTAFRANLETLLLRLDDRVTQHGDALTHNEIQSILKLLRHHSSPSDLHFTAQENHREQKSIEQSLRLITIISPNHDSNMSDQAQRYLQRYMPELYPTNDISLPPDLYAKRAMLEDCLRTANTNDQLARVFKFWSSLGGLSATGNPVVSIELPNSNPHCHCENFSASYDHMSVDNDPLILNSGPSTGPTRFGAPSSTAADADADADADKGARRQGIKRPASAPVDQRSEKKSRRSYEMSLDQDGGLDDCPGLMNDDDDEPMEVVPVPGVKYYLDGVAELEDLRREFQGHFLDEEREAVAGGAAPVVDGVWVGGYGRPLGGGLY